MTTGTQVTLHGKGTVGTFFDANGNIEKQYLIILNKSISVSKDEFGGPVRNVTKIQMIPSTERAYKSANSVLLKAVLSSQRILAYGKLEYPVSDHHHTKVYIEFDSVQLE